MSEQSLEQALQEARNPVEMLRDGIPYPFPEVPNEITNWRDEQRAWQETCSLADQSHHMTDLFVKGPDALKLLSNLGLNNFDNFEVGQAKQFVACNPDGYIIGDAILFYLDDQKFDLVGTPAAPNWVQYNAETDDYDVSIDRDEHSADREGPPKNFRYQIQGPNALDVFEAVTDEPLSETPFFNFDVLSINGREIHALRHGMSGEAGYEFWGPYEYADEIRNAVLEAGQGYGIRQLGSLSYVSSATESGWIPFPLPAVYGEEMTEYRKWLDATSYEGLCSIGGSFSSDDISDYYLNPIEMGYGSFIDFDHEFIGKEHLQKMVEDPKRTKITLVWNYDDILDSHASLFQDGTPYKRMELPLPVWSNAHYDKVLKNGVPVGISKLPAYTHNERELISLCCIDREYSDPGTEVTLIWGEESGESPNPAVESHVQTEIQATVAAVPYTEDQR